MIIVGDIASPSIEMTEKLEKVFTENQIFKNKNIICNLEGLLVYDYSEKDKTPVLYNHIFLLETMKRHNFKVAGLANNHTLDLPEQFKFTTDKLRDNNIQYNGAGLSKHEAEEPVRFLENNTEVIVLSLCWDFLLYHQKNPSNEAHIGLIKEEENIKTIQKLRADNPNATIILFLHWSFDLETLP